MQGKVNVSKIIFVNNLFPQPTKCRDQIENTLLRRKVFECIAGYSKITWIDQTTS